MSQVEACEWPENAYPAPILTAPYQERIKELEARVGALEEMLRSETTLADWEIEQAPELIFGRSAALSEYRDETEGK